MLALAHFHGVFVDKDAALPEPFPSRLNEQMVSMRSGGSCALRIRDLYVGPTHQLIELCIAQVSRPH
jgi:hypothetical protein